MTLVSINTLGRTRVIVTSLIVAVVLGGSAAAGLHVTGRAPAAAPVAASLPKPDGSGCLLVGPASNRIPASPAGFKSSLPRILCPGAVPRPAKK